MHYVKVTMKTGETHIGPLWTWRPKEGWFSLALDSSHYDGEPPDRLYLKDIQSAVNPGQRVGPDVTTNVDLLERARNDGWEPQ